MPILMRALFLLGLLFSVACSADDTSSTERKQAPPAEAEVLPVNGWQGGELRYPMAGEPSSFNYLAAADVRTRLLAYLTTATLLQYDPVRQEITAGICRDFSCSDDGMYVNLTLRKGILFSDGVPFTADDVVFTLEEIFSDSSSNALKESLLVNGKPLQVRKINDYVLEIRFPGPSAAAEYMLATIPILPRHRLSGGDLQIEEYWTLDSSPEELCGLGPFVLAEHEPGVRTVFRSNPNYWRVDAGGTQLPYLDRLTIEYVPDSNNRLLRFRAGNLDLVDYLLGPEDLPYLERDDNIVAGNLGPSSSLAFFWFNLSSKERGPEITKRGWFSRTKFRQAVNCAIDKTSIVRTVFHGLATEATSFVPSSNQRWHIEDLSSCSGRIDEAKRLLREAGFTWRLEAERPILVDEAGHAVKFELLTPTKPVLGSIAAIVEQDLSALGIDISIRQEEYRAVTSRIMTTGDYESVLMLLDFPVEPADMVNVLFSGGSLHMWNPRQESPATAWEKRIDQLMWKQLRTLDHEKRFEMFRDVQTILAEERPFIPLVNRNALFAHRRGLENVKPANTYPYSLWNVWELYWHQ